MIRVPAAAERNTKSAAEKIYKEMNAAGNSRRDDGVWRSLVARSAGGREVAGSNPVAPIVKNLDFIGNQGFFIA